MASDSVIVDIPVTDVVKLHEETLQLRNQQFLIGTIALTGSLVFNGFLIAVPGDVGTTAILMVIVVLTVLWLFTLNFLYSWSLRLKSLIGIISVYLRLTHVNGEKSSHWEEWFFLESVKNQDHAPAKTLRVSGYLSQSKQVYKAYWLYGAFSTTICFLNMISICASYSTDKPTAGVSMLAFLEDEPITLFFFGLVFFSCLYYFNHISWLRDAEQEDGKKTQKAIEASLRCQTS